MNSNRLSAYNSTAGILVLFTVLALGLYACAGRITETPLAWRMDTADKIPVGFDTYTLFIDTSYEYADEAAAAKLEILNRNFKSFGDSIGDRNLAVWVNEPGSDRLSISRGKYFADLFSRWADQSLEYSDGPFVILSDTHPDVFKTETREALQEQEPTIIVIAFNRISTQDVINVLNHLEARIRRGEISASQTSLYTLWLQMKSWVTQEESRQFLKDITLALIAKI